MKTAGVDESILVDLGVRFITTDRPGHGLSDPQPERKLLDWPDDVSQLADHLDVGKFYVMGWSAGGAPTLACATKLPERVLAAAIVSGVAPPDCPGQYKGLPFANRLWKFGARRLPALVRLMRRSAMAKSSSRQARTVSTPYLSSRAMRLRSPI